jgi:carbon-monoxide dehydrogenase medium subunit
VTWKRGWTAARSCIHRSYVANLDFAEQIVRDDGRVSLRLSDSGDRSLRWRAPVARLLERLGIAETAGEARIEAGPVQLPGRSPHALKTQFVRYTTVRAAFELLHCTVATFAVRRDIAVPRSGASARETRTMIPAAFDYHAPRSVADALKLLGQLGPDAKLLAGGHSLLPMMKLRFAQPAHLIDLGRIAELRGISQAGNDIRIGAMTTEHDLLNSKLLAEKAPLLVEGAGWIADPQVRYKGTIGGDISHGDPGNDHPALMIALDASFVLAGPKGERVVKADGFFLGLYSTQLAADEILTQIRIPVPAAGSGWSYQKLKRKTGDFATRRLMLQMKGRASRARLRSPMPGRPRSRRARPRRISPARRSTTRPQRGGAPGDGSATARSAATPTTSGRCAAR